MFEGIKNPLEGITSGIRQGKTKDGDTIHFATIDVIRQAYNDRALVYLVWEEEGSFNIGGDFVRTPKAVEVGIKPMLLDIFTASVIIQIFDNVNEKNQARMTEMVAKHRGEFMRVSDMCYKLINKAQ